MTNHLPPPLKNDDMEVADRRVLRVLEAIDGDGRITQRGLSTKLGIALGLTNIYLKRLVHKGHIKCINVQANRLRYLLTPQGIREKTRLTYEFMDYSLSLYRKVRFHLREVLQPLSVAGMQRIAIFGTGEAAELAYLSLKEQGLEPAMILDDRGGTEFLGMQVQRLASGLPPNIDRLIVATLDHPELLLRRLEHQGIPRDRLVTLRPLSDDTVRKGVA